MKISTRNFVSRAFDYVLFKTFSYKSSFFFLFPTRGYAESPDYAEREGKRKCKN